MPSRGTTAARAAVLMVMAASLMGCADGEPRETPPPIPAYTPPSPEPTASEPPAPETVAPERPAAIDEPTVEGAEALAWYFLDLYGYAYATGDLAEWNRLSHPECQFCMTVAESVSAQLANGHTSQGGGITVEAFVVDSVTEGFAIVSGRVVQESATVVDGTGAVIEETGSEALDVLIAIEELDRAWRFRELEIDEGDAA